MGKTVIGASKATYGDEGGSDTVTPSVTVNSATQSVSVNGHTLTTDEMPSHVHTPENANSAFVTNVYPNLGSWQFVPTNPNNLNANGGMVTASTGGSSSHTHGVTTSEHTHSLNISSFDNRSSFKALYKIMRLA